MTVQWRPLVKRLGGNKELPKPDVLIGSTIPGAIISVGPVVDLVAGQLVTADCSGGNTITFNLPEQPDDGTVCGVFVVNVGGGHYAELACQGTDTFPDGSTAIDITVAGAGLLAQYSADLAAAGGWTLAATASLSLFNILLETSDLSGSSDDGHVPSSETVVNYVGSFVTAYVASALGASATFTLGLDTSAGLTSNDNTHVPSTAAVRSYVAGQLTSVMHFAGTIACNTNPNYPASNVGDAWVVSSAGKIGGTSGSVVDAGDTVICITTNAGGTQASVGADFDIVQSNVVAPLSGPGGSVTNNHLVKFTSGSGSVVGDAGAVISTDGTMAGNANTNVPTEAAVVTYVGAQVTAAVAAAVADRDVLIWMDL